MRKRILLPTSFFFIALFSTFLFGFMIGSFCLAQIIHLKTTPSPIAPPTITSVPERPDENTFFSVKKNFHRELCPKVEIAEDYEKKRRTESRKELIGIGLIPCPHCNP